MADGGLHRDRDGGQGVDQRGDDDAALGVVVLVVVEGALAGDEGEDGL